MVYNHSHYFLWDVIILPCHNFKGCLIKSPLKLGHGWVIAPTSFRGCNNLSMPKIDDDWARQMGQRSDAHIDLFNDYIGLSYHVRNTMIYVFSWRNVIYSSVHFASFVSLLLGNIPQYGSFMGLLPNTLNCGLRMRREWREHFPRHRLHRKPPVIDPGMHHGTCVTHVPWCMSGSITRDGGENVPGIPGACATLKFTYLARGPWVHRLSTTPVHTLFTRHTCK